MALERLDNVGMEEVLSDDPMKRQVDAAAKQVVANVKAMGILVGDKPGGYYQVELPVDRLAETTDRAISIVALSHPAGLAVQAKYGALTKAAAQAGLEVTEDR